jgi:hypothetical protein
MQELTSDHEMIESVGFELIFSSKKNDLLHLKRFRLVELICSKRRQHHWHE